MISNPQKFIRFISNSYVGTAHDFGILKQEFPPSKAWFAKHDVRVDLGFEGFDKLYSSKNLQKPHKKPRKAQLSDEQKLENQKKASERVAIEQSIGVLKRYRFLSDRLRAHDFLLYDQALGICAGLWNFSLKHAIH